MLLTQKNRLNLSKEEFRIISLLSFHCAKMYNVGLYSVKQHFQRTSQYLKYNANYHECKNSEHYKILLASTGQQILRLVERDYKSFFALLRAKQIGKYSSEVNPPNYKKDIFVVSIQGNSAKIKNGFVFVGLNKTFRRKYNPSFKKLKFKLPPNIKVDKLQELRIVPIYNGKEFDIEFVYKKEFESKSLNNTNSLSIDLGINNFATCFDGQNGCSFIMDGKYIKSVNQLYNKVVTKLQKGSRKFIRISDKRNNKINNTFNLYVKYITNYCIINNIGCIIVGDLSDAKCELNFGRVNNQKFQFIPYGKFIRKLTSKCQQLGIQLYLQEESYTSKCSFFDNEEVCQHDIYKGKRIGRGLFRTSDGLLVNADVNGAANILQKSKRRVSDRACSGFIRNPKVLCALKLTNFFGGV